MTTALFHLRCKQIGFTFEEIRNIRTGHIFDIFTESANDGAEYDTLASQEDMDNF